MNKTTQSILDDNHGRDPERLQMKLRAIRGDAFAFFRGTAPLFYASLDIPVDLQGAPRVVVCGDLHLENFSSYKGDNRLVYFDMSDFDEACVAPCTFDLIRFLSSILLAAKSLSITGKQASALMTTFVDVYASNLSSAKPRWVERATALGPVKQLLQSVKNRHRCDLIAKRCIQKKTITTLIIDGTHALKASAADRKKAESILSAHARTQSVTSPSHFKPIDIARRIAGNGSLGLARYIALVRGDGTADGRYLIDIKVANPSALAANLDRHHDAQPEWASEAARVVSLQYLTQAIPPALLGGVCVGEQSYIIKELQPTADRINLRALKAKSGELEDVIKTMAEITAWAHLRGTARFGASDIDALSKYATDTAWKESIKVHAKKCAALVQQQWQAYADDYDSGAITEALPIADARKK